MRVPFLMLALLTRAVAEEKHWAYVSPVKTEIPAGTNPVDTLLAKAWGEARSSNGGTRATAPVAGARCLHADRPAAFGRAVETHRGESR